MDFALPADRKAKFKESEKKYKYQDLSRELKNTVEKESDVYTNHNCCYWYSHQRINKGPGGIGNKRMSGEHPNYNTIEIGQNTEKSPGDLEWLTVIQTPVKDHLLTLMGKNSQGVNNNKNGVVRIVGIP